MVSSLPLIVKLRVLSGDLQGQVFSVDPEVVIGRSTTCHMFVPDRRISREHARIFRDNLQLFVEDLRSHNGTYVNGQRVVRAELFRGDLVRLGSSQFVVEMASALDSSAVQFVNDVDTMQPKLVRPVAPMTTGESLSDLVARDYFARLGLTDVEELRSRESVEQLLQRTRHFAILYEVSKTLQRYTDMREQLPNLMDLILQVVRGDRGALLMFDEAGELVPRTVRYSDRALNSDELPAMTISKSVAQAVIQERCAIITADATTDARFAGSQSIMLANVRSLLAVPVQVGNRLIGLIEIENTRSLNGFDENDMHLVSIVASMLGVALDNFEATQARELAIAKLEATQAQLIAAQQRLVASERMGMLGRLASGIAHEVKNHLSPFMLADMIASKYPDDQETQETTVLMLEAQQRIVGLVDEIRSFARGDQTSVNIASHDIGQVIEGVLRFMACDRAVKATEIVFWPGERPMVFIDAHRIRQVLINLIRNAADAIPPRYGRIDIRVHTDLGDVVVEVQDNGSGISPMTAARVFEPFFSTKGEKGLGLGLDISRQIAVAHGGTLTFESRESTADAHDGGTIFRLRLPLVHQAVDDEAFDDRPFDDLKTDPHGHGTLSPLTTPPFPER